MLMLLLLKIILLWLENFPLVMLRVQPLQQEQQQEQQQEKQHHPSATLPWDPLPTGQQQQQQHQSWPLQQLVVKLTKPATASKVELQQARGRTAQSTGTDGLDPSTPPVSQWHCKVCIS
jgi:hypothetical protein